MPNSFLRGLNAKEPPEGFVFPMWKEEGDFLIGPDEQHWYIEKAHTVGDFVRPGTLIYSMYQGERWGGVVRVAKVHRHTECVCPYVGYFRKYCEDGDLKYHREVVAWSINYVSIEAKPKLDGTYSNNDFFYINDIVYKDGRFVSIYNVDEVELELAEEQNDIELPPMQTSFL